MAQTASYCSLGRLGHYSGKSLHLRWHLNFFRGGQLLLLPSPLGWLQPCHIRMSGSAVCALSCLSILHLNSSFTVTGDLLNYL